jgi:8-oxo-dGTP pyrophosphatase MutT (NUDIX family)
MTAEEPIERLAARALLIDGQNRVLLLQGSDGHRPELGHWWHVPGGGLDPGETAHAAARRELREEVGYEVGELIESVHEEVVHFSMEGRRYRQRQSFFVVRVESFEADFSGQTALERATVLAARWWTATELRATTDTFYPAELPDLLDRITSPSSETDPAEADAS